MKTIRFKSKTVLYVNGVKYRSYTLGELPTKFAYYYNEYKDNYGLTSWFNYAGLTWVVDER